MARQQQARSFELHPAVGLAKLYGATHRKADARAVLAPVLEGCSPSLELPEMEEARSLFADLAKGEDRDTTRA